MNLQSDYVFGLVSKVDHDAGYILSSKLTTWQLHVATGPDPFPHIHDHAGKFIFFPLVSFAETVFSVARGVTHKQSVLAGVLYRREAEYSHRELGALYRRRPATGEYVHSLHGARIERRQLPLMTRLAWRIFGEGTLVSFYRFGPDTREPGVWLEYGNGFIWKAFSDYLDEETEVVWGDE